MTAEETHWIVEKKPAELNQPAYLKDVLIDLGMENICVMLEKRFLLLLPQKKSYRYHQD